MSTFSCYLDVNEKINMTKYFTTLSPSGLLGLLIGIEASNAFRYREWADRFRPFNEKVSALFDEMADCDDAHYDDLFALYTEQFGSLIASDNSQEIDKHTQDAKDVEAHFFVVDNTMAKNILTAALHTLAKARHIYQAILSRSQSTVLRKAYKPHTISDSGHTRRLKDYLLEFQPLQLKGT